MTRESLLLMIAAAAFCMAAPLTAIGQPRESAPRGADNCRLGGVPVPGFAVASLDPQPFQALHAAVAPRGRQERWLEIPWEPDLAAARERAARERKPLLMWIMDGHPLGCT